MSADKRDNVVPFARPAPKRSEEGTTEAHNQDAERAVLAAVFKEPASLTELRMVLPKPDMFFSHCHAHVWKVMCAIQDENTALDALTVGIRYASEFGRGAHLPTGGDIVAELVRIRRTVPLVENPIEYAKVVFDAWRMRETEQLAKEAHLATRYQSDGRAETTDPEKILVKMIETAQAIVDANPFADTPLDQHASVVSLMQGYASAEERGAVISGHSTGLRAVDEMCGGLFEQSLIVVGARPGCGKTALMDHVSQAVGAQHIEVTPDGRIAQRLVQVRSPDGIITFEPIPPQAMLQFTMEMSTAQMTLRALCSRAGVDSKLFRSGTVSQEDWGRLTIAASQIVGHQVYRYDKIVGHEQIAAITRQTKRILASRGIKLAGVCVDYLQKMEYDHMRRTPQDGIGENVAGLKTIAKNENVFVLALAQLKRSVDQNPKDVPKISDIRDCGKIEQEADDIWFFHRDHKEPHSPKIYVCAQKARSGPNFIVPVGFHKVYTRFYDLPPDQMDVPEHIQLLPPDGEGPGSPSRRTGRHHDHLPHGRYPAVHSRRSREPRQL